MEKHEKIAGGRGFLKMLGQITSVTIAAGDFDVEER